MCTDEALLSGSHTDKLFALTLDLMVVKDASTHVWLHVNPQVMRTLGYSKTELTSQSSMNFLHPEDRAETERRANSVPIDGVIQNFENRYLTRDGRVVRLSWTAVFEPSENLVYAVAKDVTTMKQQEQEIARQKMEIAVASKLSSLGQFAAGIAHEVNNPLTIVYGQTCKLRKALGQTVVDQEEILKIAEQIENMAARIVRIINGLRAFTREGSNDAFEIVSLKSILEDTLAFCRGKFKDQKINFTVDAIPEYVKVSARPVQISQVLLNLLNNAYDAVVDTSERWIRLEFETTATDVKIKVIDSGCGVCPELRSQLFNAFFTTKPIGNGTGLGLNIAKMISSAHDGDIYLDDSATHTTFVVRLPTR